MTVPPAALLAGVELLSLDAGNTLIFLDHTRVALELTELGHPTSAEVLVRTEGEAKRLQVVGELDDPRWIHGALHEAAPGALGWGRMVGTLVGRAGVPPSELPRVLEALWVSHVRWNLWSKVPEGLRDALLRARTGGVRVVVVSNSEGMLDSLFADLGLTACFDAVADSGKLGVEKPDPRIFELAFAPFGIMPGAVLHLGDSMATDIEGARAAGLRSALVDPFGHWEGLFPEVPRVPGVVDVVAALLRARPA